jgi:hypothetical protein
MELKLMPQSKQLTVQLSSKASELVANLGTIAEVAAWGTEALTNSTIRLKYDLAASVESEAMVGAQKATKLFIIHFFKPNATQQGLQARSYAT